MRSRAAPPARDRRAGRRRGRSGTRCAPHRPEAPRARDRRQPAARSWSTCRRPLARNGSRPATTRRCRPASTSIWWLSTMSWCTRSGVRASAVRVTSGAGSTSRKLPPLDHSTSMSPRARGLDHLRRVEPALRRHLESPLRAQRGCVLRVDRQPTGKRRRVAAHLRAALHAGVAADRHQACARPPDVAPRERQVHDRAHVVDAGRVLRDAHRPHEHRRLGLGVHAGEPRHVVAVVPDKISSRSKDSSSS